ncbi:hypothetical protein AVEN_259136-1 [Araneus ventricosus]|uniref:Endonuclease/exonuclease/phosphatase domain-containing protein n=1 Tax=Araneus ventricosus TaxID=182803 RepID=A0A4Y2DAG3_ARAVE|nr:hypothetical protein AVEN_259136-1 [Araneus ventricosus]
MAAFISWNCRGFMNKSSELKDIINKHNPACIALQETYLTTDKHYLRNYEIFSKHHIQDHSSGGVALLAASHISSMTLNLNTNLQAVAIRIQMPLRGSSSIDVTGFTTPRYPSVYFSFRLFLPLSFLLFSSFPRGY